MTLPLVIGLGRTDRGDDAIGPEAARILAERCGPDVEVVASDQPADLIDVWSGRELVVVVDALRSGAEPGTIHVLHLHAAQANSAKMGWRSSGQGGTHALGIDVVVGLADAMGLLPSKLVLVCVEGSSFAYGEPMSPAVAGSLEAVVAEVTAQVAGEGFARSGPASQADPWTDRIHPLPRRP